MDSQLMVLFAIAFTCAVAVPGPNVAFVVAQTIKYGHKIILPCSLGFLISPDLQLQHLRAYR
ncbi:hypothetical protein IXO278_09830 [Xanthomonas oryzae pv. oryzae]|nr:hypothetical protein IXO278_09830 [Xanthomonas oryzae pv. oryzae]